jgi:ABC-type glutathione transport system ATPase component
MLRVRGAADKYALKTENLTKTIGNLLVVDNLNLEIRRREVFGFLGPNGAGKTTSVKMMVGLLKRALKPACVFPLAFGVASLAPGAVLASRASAR